MMHCGVPTTHCHLVCTVCLALQYAVLSFVSRAVLWCTYNTLPFSVHRMPCIVRAVHPMGHPMDPCWTCDCLARMHWPSDVGSP
eukprot:415326-Pelagomonas_calceolata.AAC.1